MLQVATSPDGQLALRGELDLLSVPALQAVLAQLNGHAVVDMSGVTLFDSCALRTFLDFRRRNTDLRIANPSKAVVQVLEITGTVEYLVSDGEVDW